MSSPRQFIFKRKSLRKLFSGLFLDYHHHRQDKGDEIDDDWELIEVQEEEFPGAGEEDIAVDGQDSDVIDFPDHLPFPSFNFPETIKFKILGKADVRQLLEDKISMLCSIVPLSRAQAIVLLHHFKWDVDRAQDEWLEREKKVRPAVGLFERPVAVTSYASVRPCGICPEKLPGNMSLAVSCGHQFCRPCWTEYISKAIGDGPRCLALRCPSPSCGAAVGPDMVDLLVSEKDKEKFENHLLKSYLISCEEAKWCPAPGCEYALFSFGDGDSSNNVTCRCLYRFCWKCTKEAHSPVDCSTVDKWMSEMSVQSENWMLANTTPCPNCKLPIEAIPGYKHFEQCTSCKYEFCCECGAHPSNHMVTEQYWQYNCRLDNSLRPAGFHIVDGQKRELAKKSLERYNSYYQQWVTTESCRTDALTDLKLFHEVQLPMLREILMIPPKELDFLVEAHLQIAECWQLLKWAYVYVYFLSEEERLKMPLLEFMQGQAEDLVKLLHKHVVELKHSLLQGDVPIKRLKDCRNNLVQLTGVTRTHFDKMAMALNSRLPEVVFIPTPSTRKMSRLKIWQEESSSGDSPSPSPSPMFE
uniref:RBR-type E3 ubiquitin transferase n=2 Tax=Opuntia streptacantha TaxID=393608 RepID=A0A7C9ANZ0_OPUST